MSVKVLLVLIIIMTGLFAIIACGDDDDGELEITAVPMNDDAESDENSQTDEVADTAPIQAAPVTSSVESPEAMDAPDPTVLALNEKTRNGYMNNCLFLGDSRTVAMVSYGFVSDDNVLAQVGIAHTSVEKNTFTNNAGMKYVFPHI